MNNEYNWSVPQRQPVSAVFIAVYKSVISIIKFLWPAFLAWMFSATQEGEKGNKWMFIIIIASAWTLIYSLIEFFFFRFSIVDEELVVKKGFFVRKNLILPLGKIQTVHLQQSWLQRIFNLMEVSFDSPGSKEAEVKILLKADSAEALRLFIVGSTAAVVSEEPGEFTPPASFSLSSSELIKLAFTANYMKTFVLMITFSIAFLDNVKIAFKEEYDQLIDWLGEAVVHGSILIFFSIFIVVTIVSVIISFVGVVLKYANFRLSKTGKGFKIQTGMINRIEKLAPFRKVQYISWRANWIRRWIPIYMLHYHAIGDAVKDPKQEDVRVPLMDLSSLPFLLSEYHPLIDDEAPAIRLHPAVITSRVFMTSLIVLPLVTAGFFAFKYNYSLWGLVFIPLTFLNAWLFHRNFRFRIGADALLVRRGAYGKEFVLLQWNKIQSVKIQQTFIQRRRNLATVKLFTASGLISVPFVKLEQARAIGNYGLYKIEEGK